MGKTKRKAETIYIDHEKFELIAKLAAKTRVPRAVLWREALDDLLTKYGALKSTSENFVSLSIPISPFK